MQAIYTPPLFVLMWVAGLFMVAFPATMKADAGISMRSLLILLPLGIFAWEARDLAAYLPVLARWMAWTACAIMVAYGAFDGLAHQKREGEG